MGSMRESRDSAAYRPPRCISVCKVTGYDAMIELMNFTTIKKKPVTLSCASIRPRCRYARDSAVFRHNSPAGGSSLLMRGGGRLDSRTNKVSRLRNNIAGTPAGKRPLPQRDRREQAPNNTPIAKWRKSWRPNRTPGPFTDLGRF